MEYEVITSQKELIKVDAKLNIVTINGKRVQDCSKKELEYAFLRLVEKTIDNLIDKNLQ